ncbi:MAG: response regulator [Bdellovibrionota bacterium]
MKTESDRDEQQGASETDFKFGEEQQPVWDLIRLDGVKILLVEDVPDARAVIGRILVRSGASVISAESADEARNILASSRPDVIVSDIAMPDEDGLSFLRSLRALDEVTGDHIPAVALTAFTDEMSKRQIFKAGFEAHVGKGSSSELLLTTIFKLARGLPPSVH